MKNKIISVILIVVLNTVCITPLYASSTFISAGPPLPKANHVGPNHRYQGSSMSTQVQNFHGLGQSYRHNSGARYYGQWHRYNRYNRGEEWAWMIGSTLAAILIIRTLDDAQNKQPEIVYVPTQPQYTNNAEIIIINENDPLEKHKTTNTNKQYYIETKYGLVPLEVYYKYMVTE